MAGGGMAASGDKISALNARGGMAGGIMAAAAIISGEPGEKYGRKLTGGNELSSAGDIENGVAKAMMTTSVMHQQWWRQRRGENRAWRQ